jgi:7-keto-8-aminopelargonate synthetase-like enzyme
MYVSREREKTLAVALFIYVDLGYLYVDEAHSIGALGHSGRGYFYYYYDMNEL